MNIKEPQQPPWRGRPVPICTKEVSPALAELSWLLRVRYGLSTIRIASLYAQVNIRSKTGRAYLHDAVCTYSLYGRLGTPNKKVRATVQDRFQKRMIEKHGVERAANGIDVPGINALLEKIKAQIERDRLIESERLIKRLEELEE